MTSDERELLESYERAEWMSIPNMEEEIGFYKKVAQNSLKKDARINIRISSRDLLEI